MTKLINLLICQYFNNEKTFVKTQKDRSKTLITKIVLPSLLFALCFLKTALLSADQN